MYFTLHTYYHDLFLSNSQHVGIAGTIKKRDSELKEIFLKDKKNFSEKIKEGDIDIKYFKSKTNLNKNLSLLFVSNNHTKLISRNSVKIFKTQETAINFLTKKKIDTIIHIK